MRILISFLIMMSVFAPRLEAAEYYSLSASSSVEITEHATCKYITNNLANGLFIPTKTSAEWTAFYTNSPLNVDSIDCVTFDPKARYRSVGPNNVSPLAVGTTNDLTISGSIATFASALPNNVGVGDALVFDDDNDSDIDASDTIAFIHRRNSSTSYTLRLADGSSVADLVTPDNNWSIYRAYTALEAADYGYENTGIPAALRDFDPHVDGQDITSSDEIWMIACYADDIETYDAIFSNWVTDSDNYIQIYTPKESYEVGTSQRHDGTFTGGGFEMTAHLSAFNTNIRIDGLKFSISSSASWEGVVFYDSGGAPEEYYFTNNLLDRSWNNSSSRSLSIYGAAAGTKHFIVNNVIANTGTSSNTALEITGTAVRDVYMYNNTLYSTNSSPIIRNVGNVYAINNISYGVVNDDYYDSGSNGSFVTFDYNVSYNDTTAGDHGGTGNTSNASVSFVNIGTLDFHLDSGDTVALGTGTDLDSDPNYPFTKDIDGVTRISGSWNRGAAGVE